MSRSFKSFVVLCTLIALASSGRASENPIKVDLNRASVEELIKLPHIGPALAERIVKYRKDNGGFHKLDDLLAVSGIGRKTFDVLKDKVTVSETQAAPPAK